MYLEIRIGFVKRLKKMLEMSSAGVFAFNFYTRQFKRKHLVAELDGRGGKYKMFQEQRGDKNLGAGGFSDRC